jgi:hypothetical protein
VSSTVAYHILRKSYVLLQVRMEGVLDFLVVEGVNEDLGDDVGEGDDEEGEEEQDPGVEDGVEGEREEDHQTHPQHHRTQLQVPPVDDVERHGVQSLEELQVSTGLWQATLS